VTNPDPESGHSEKEPVELAVPTEPCG